MRKAHRVTQRTLGLYISNDNLNYTLVQPDKWQYAKDQSTGVITITLNERLAARYLKLHVKFDERDANFGAVNRANFLNNVAEMLRVYQEATSRTEEFEYDAAGNRKLQRVTLVQTNSFTSYYYPDSDRLKTDGKYAFKYDDAGNMIAKGNRFEPINSSSDPVVYKEVKDEGAEYWEYRYDLLNRLIEVTKNGTIMAGYAYDPEGLRTVKRKYVNGIINDTIHYVFEGTEPIFEKRISDRRIRSYVYALGKHLARVDGHEAKNEAGEIVQVIDNTYFYHTDYMGSIRAITNSAGTVVWKADYESFGKRLGDGSESKLDNDLGFTGKEWDPDIGMYYFNARWYDPELGRFISEDPAVDFKKSI